jgi:hypothetical protein
MLIAREPSRTRHSFRSAMFVMEPILTLAELGPGCFFEGVAVTTLHS